MDYNYFINDPKTGRNVSIYSRKGQQIINEYAMNQHGGTKIPYYDYKATLDAGQDRTVPTKCMFNKNPECHWPDWAKILIDNMEQIQPQATNPELVDDHDGTLIGNGYTIGLVSGILNISAEDLEQIPDDLRTGILEKEGNFTTCIRFSEAPVDKGNYHLARLAAKICLAHDRELDILTTETGQNFPIPNNHGLSIFHSGEATKHGSMIGKTVSALGTFGRVVRYGPAFIQLFKNSKPTEQQLREKHLPYTVAGREYYSMSPFAIDGKHSSAVVKFAFIPKAKTRHLFTNTELAREAQTADQATLATLVKDVNTKYSMKEGFKHDVENNDIEFDFKIQFSTDPERDPINYLTKNWESPYYKVGTLTIPKQKIVKDGMSAIFASHFDNTKRLSFVPGKIHRGVGDISAYRNYLYPLYNKARQQHLLGNDGKPLKCPFGFMMRQMMDPSHKK